MMELKPCPFCGVEAEFVDSYAPFEALRCANPDCYAGSVEVKHFYRDKLIEAWNTRAERTCFKVIPNEMEGYVFCSRCGAEIGEYGVPNYCHCCGAKVVS